MKKLYVFDVAEIEAESREEAEDKLIAQGYNHYYLLTTVPVGAKIFRCKRCKDVYDSEELKELRAEGERYNKEPFLCPDCFDEFERLDSEDQLKYLMEGRYDW